MIPVFIEPFLDSINGYSTHAALGGRLPEPGVDGTPLPISFASYRQKHCRGLYQTPIAASF